jgi:hypothetical protein
VAFRNSSGGVGVHARSFGTEVPKDDAWVLSSAGILSAGAGCLVSDGGRDANRTAAGTAVLHACEGSGAGRFRNYSGRTVGTPFPEGLTSLRMTHEGGNGDHTVVVGGSASVTTSPGEGRTEGKPNLSCLLCSGATKPEIFRDKGPKRNAEYKPDPRLPRRDVWVYVLLQLQTCTQPSPVLGSAI